MGDIYRNELNDLFHRTNTNTYENSVSKILKELYSEWFFYEYNFNNPLTNQVCRKLDNILPKDDGGGQVQYKFY